MALLDADGDAIDQRLRMIRHQRKRSLDAEQRFVKAAKLQQHLAVIVIRIGRCCVEFERGANEFERALAVAALLMNDPEQMRRIEMLRRKLEDAGIEPFGVIEQTAAMQRDAGFHRLADRLLLRVIALCRRHDCFPCSAGVMRSALFLRSNSFLA